MPPPLIDTSDPAHTGWLAIVQSAAIASAADKYL